jgi:hypothetical protein
MIRTKSRRDFVESLTKKALTAITASQLPWATSTLFADSESYDRVEQDHQVDYADTVVLYDTYMMAMYMDGTLGPKTGILKVDYVIEGQPLAFDFWHGHGGKVHKFELKAEHFTLIKQRKKIIIETTSVDRHTHKLFIDPVDLRWRVPGSEPVEIPVDQPVPDDHLNEG